MSKIVNQTVSATSDMFIKYLFGMDTAESNKLVLSFINAVLIDSDFPSITEAQDRDYILTDHLVLHFLELPKLKIFETGSKMDRWLLFDELYCSKACFTKEGCVS